ncbi:peptidoglycan-binding protein [Shouchella sp. JSM 1781072]|uniref:peptidoglycan-binding protein n=1 Tax=Shouchella sp. JSM 1781072 TaxID=3344581 RepID=UPI0035C03A2F
MEGFTINAIKLGLFTSATFMMISSSAVVQAKTEIEIYAHLIGLSHEYSGDEVIELRKLLESIDVKTGELKHTFDNNLEFKIKEFQESHDLNVSGVVDEDTIQTIIILLDAVNSKAIETVEQNELDVDADYVDKDFEEYQGSVIEDHLLEVETNESDTQEKHSNTESIEELNEDSEEFEKVDEIKTITKNDYQEFNSKTVTSASAAEKVTINQRELILRNGVYHQRVVTLKKNLAVLGFLVQGSYTDHYGPLTAEQVRAFQRSRGLAVTGEVTFNLEKQIEELATGPLRVGMYREDVVSFKKKLAVTGFFVSANPNTYFGPDTEKQLKAFQTKYGLNPDGIAGPITLDKLNQVSSGTLMEGMTDERVVSLKWGLATMGFPVSGSGNAHYGPLTAEQVRAFQNSVGLPATGIADPKTIEQLDQLANGNLQTGMYRKDVINLKLMLAEAGYFVSKNPNIYFGPQTSEKLRAFQKAYGLIANGMFDGATEEKLKEVSSQALKDGTYNERVIKLKEHLYILGYPVPGSFTNHYGPLTANQVRAFQVNYGLSPTGIADVNTLLKIAELAEGPLRFGMNRSDAIQLKLDLAKVGFEVSINPNEYFGAATEQSVRSFQKAYGLPITGIANQQTLDRLAQEISRQTTVYEFSMKERFGHGVGMTQWGAYGMALNGHNYSQILNHYYTNVSVGFDQQYVNQLIRVALGVQINTTTISSSTRYSIFDINGKTIASNITGTTTIQYGAGGSGAFVITNGNQTFESRDELSIRTDATGTVQYKGNYYLGEMRLLKSYVSTGNTTVKSNYVMDVVNVVDINDYLNGVVPYEMVPSWNQIEAFKAQAIASRTYALYRLRQTGNFDVYDDTRSQVYHGVPQGDRNNGLMRRSISETNGIVIKYNNRLIDAIYSASASGHSVDASYMWGNDVAYLRGVSDPYDVSRFNNVSTIYEINLTDLSKLGGFSSMNLGEVLNLEFTNQFERLINVNVTFERGSSSFTADEFRQIVGTNYLPSNIMSIRTK